MDKMRGMVAIVTGSSRGLGRAIALEYGREGAMVVACARPASPTQLPGTVAETAQAILDQGGESLAIACDVSDEAQVKSMVQQAVDRYGKVDVLVNTACNRIVLDDADNWKTLIINPTECLIALGEKKWEDWKPDEFLH